MYSLYNGICTSELEPTEFFLAQNYPNPFKERTVIKYCVANKTRVRLEILNPEGKVIKMLVDEEKEAGTYEVEFNASVCHSSEGQNLLDGIYLYRLQAGKFLQTKKMLLLK